MSDDRKSMVEVCDGALAALALTEASVTDNPVNREAILRDTPPVELVSGFVALVASLRASYAAELGCPVTDVDEALRALFLQHTADAL